MTARRAARAAGTTHHDSTVPAALRDRHDPLWHDPQAVTDLARTHRLTLDLRRYDTAAAAPAWARFDAFRDAYTHSHALVDRWGRPDRPRMADAGIDTSSSVRERIRTLATDGENVRPRE